MRLRIWPSIIVVLVLAVALSTCGIEDYEVLYPPFEESTGTTLVIQHNSSNDSTGFLGYQIYYRIYCTADSSSPAAAAVDAANIEANWSDVFPDVVIKRLGDAGYSAMVSSTDTLSIDVAAAKAPPLVNIALAEIPKNVRAIFYLGSTDGAWEKTVDGVISDTFYARRSVKDNSGYYRLFTDFTNGSDCDTTAAYYWIRAYAFAYGVDSNFTAIYSKPILITPVTVELSN